MVAAVIALSGVMAPFIQTSRSEHFGLRASCAWTFPLAWLVLGWAMWRNRLRFGRPVAARPGTQLTRRQRFSNARVPVAILTFPVVMSLLSWAVLWATH